MTTDPPPTSVIVTEVCTVSVTVVTPQAQGNYDTGMGKSGVVTWVPGGNNTGGATDTRYSVHPGGPSVDLKPSVDAKATALEPGATSSVYYTAGIAPVFVIPSGATKDSSGNYNILVGQGCTASLSQSTTSNISPFSGALVSANPQSPTYKWSISGITFQDWEPTTPGNPKASYYSGGSGPLTNATAKWYWNDPPTSETISCTATLIPPIGQGSTFSVTATQKVSLQFPTWMATGTGGYMQVNTFAPGIGPDYALYAGPTDRMVNNQQPGGMNFTATSVTPPLFGKGNLELVQLVTPNLSYVTNTSPPVVHTDTERSLGLDIHYPKSSSPPVPYAEGVAPYKANDSPGIDLTYFNAGSAIEKHQFVDYLMYLAPGDSKWIALAQFNWSVNGSATIPGTGTPSTGSWHDYVTQNGSDAAGTVTPNTTPVSFTAVYGPGFFVSWNTINVFPDF